MSEACEWTEIAKVLLWLTSEDDESLRVRPSPGPYERGLLAGFGWLLVYVAAGPVALALLLPIPNRY